MIQIFGSFILPNGMEPKQVEKVFTATARHPDHMEIFNFNNNDGSKYKMVIKCSISVSARLL